MQLMVRLLKFTSIKRYIQTSLDYFGEKPFPIINGNRSSTVKVFQYEDLIVQI